MAFTDIDFSLPQWGKSLNDTLRKIWGGYPSTSEWTDSITYMNGFGPKSDDLPNTLKYRVIDSDGQRTIQFAGWMKMPAMTDSQIIECAKIPVNLFNGHTGFIQQYDRFFCAWGDQWLSIVIDPATGILSVRNMSTRGDKSLAAGAFQINYSVSW